MDDENCWNTQKVVVGPTSKAPVQKCMGEDRKRPVEQRAGSNGGERSGNLAEDSAPFSYPRSRCEGGDAPPVGVTNLQHYQSLTSGTASRNRLLFYSNPFWKNDLLPLKPTVVRPVRAVRGAVMLLLAGQEPNPGPKRDRREVDVLARAWHRAQKKAEKSKALRTQIVNQRIRDEKRAVSERDQLATQGVEPNPGPQSCWKLCCDHCHPPRACSKKCDVEKKLLCAQRTSNGMHRNCVCNERVLPAIKIDGYRTSSSKKTYDIDLARGRICVYDFSLTSRSIESILKISALKPVDCAPCASAPPGPPVPSPSPDSDLSDVFHDDTPSTSVPRAPPADDCATLPEPSAPPADECPSMVIAITEAPCDAPDKGREEIPTAKSPVTDGDEPPKVRAPSAPPSLAAGPVNPSAPEPKTMNDGPRPVSMAEPHSAPNTQAQEAGPIIDGPDFAIERTQGFCAFVPKVLASISTSLVKKEFKSSRRIRRPCTFDDRPGVCSNSTLRLDNKGNEKGKKLLSFYSSMHSFSIRPSALGVAATSAVASLVAAGGVLTAGALLGTAGFAVSAVFAAAGVALFGAAIRRCNFSMRYDVIPDWLTSILTSTTDPTAIRTTGVRRCLMASTLNIPSGQWLYHAHQTSSCAAHAVEWGFTPAPTVVDATAGAGSQS